MEPESLSQAMKRFNALGYTEDFRSQAAKLLATPSQKSFRAIDLTVDQVFRLEGETDLDEESILFALSDPKSGLKGTYLIAYGINMDPADVEILQQLTYN